MATAPTKADREPNWRYFQMPAHMCKAADRSIINYTGPNPVPMSAYDKGLWWVVPCKELERDLDKSLAMGAFLYKKLIYVNPADAANPKNWTG